jgi:hypothetical protein
MVCKYVWGGWSRSELEAAADATANQRKRYVVDRDELVEVEFGPQEDIRRYRPI